VTATPPSALLPDDVLAEVAFIGLKLVLQAGHKVISTSIPEIPRSPEPATDRSTPDSKEAPWRSGIS